MPHSKTVPDSLLKLPPNRDIVAGLSLLSCCFWGFGYNWLPAFALSACWSLHAFEQDGAWKRALPYGLVALALAAHPHVGMLYGALAATLWLTTGNRMLSAAPLALWIAEELPLETGIWPLIPIARLLIVIAACMLTHRIKSLPAILMGVCVTLTIVDMSQPKRFDSLEEYKDMGSGYSPGNSLRKVLGVELPASTSGSAPLRGYLHGSKLSPELPGLIMVEHDQWKGRANEPIAETNQQVDVPWHSNCWPGRQYLRHAISKDGFVSSNLGGSLTDKGRVELCYMEHGEIKPVLVSRGATTWSADSDYLNNALTVYNRWYVPELNRCGAYFKISRLANLLMACVLFLPATGGAWTAMLACLAVTSTALPGEIRVAGGIGDPHDEGGASGVPDIINGKGLATLPGAFGAKVLIVPPNTWAIHHGEKTVVIGGGSTLLSLSLGVIKTDDNPLGQVGDIVDARTIQTGGNTAIGSLKAADGTIIIGTSSPGRLQWESLYK